MRSLLLSVSILVLCSLSHAADFRDFPISEDLAGIIMAYETMSLEDRVNELPGRIRDYVAKNPADPLGFYLLGIMDMDLQQFDTALSAFGTAIALAPELSDAHAQSALALVYSRQVDPVASATSTLALAASAIGCAVELNPERPDFQAVVATVYLEQGEIEAAAGAMGRAVLLSPASVAYHQQLFALFLRTGHAYRAAEELDLVYILGSGVNPVTMNQRSDLFESLAPMQTSVRRALNEPDSALLEVKQFINQKNYSDAAARCTDLLKQFPHHPEVLYQSALTYWNAFQDRNTALNYLDRALNEAPLFVPAREFRCILQMQPDRPTEEADEEGTNDSSEVCMGLVSLARKADMARDALSSAPGNAPRLMEVGNALVQLARPDRAIPYIAAASILDPGNPDIMAALERVRQAVGIEISDD